MSKIPQEAIEAITWFDLDTAPKDGTIVKLKVLPGSSDDDGWTPFEDSLEPYETIGFNQLYDTTVDRWHFAGWDWQYECFTEGFGQVLAWAPFNSTADAARAQGAEVAVKPLEWRVFCKRSGNCEAKSTVGEYVIQFEYSPLQSFWALYLPFKSVSTGIRHMTLEEAKAAAQADYEQRIRSALTTPPAPQPTDREKVLEGRIEADRQFVQRHPSLSATDVAEFEVFLKVPETFAALAGGEA